ncbi:hypothetical protein BDZ89DRAFT_1138665 [Hymenopellis radicata]|nr:hypothetical protein BDZ89DRAFT_1138665 [Hymenopellis radicata]
MAQADKTHPDYCSSDADVFIRSSDRVIFNLHSDNLKAHTNAIPFDSFSSTTNIADFGESSEVLAVLFKFLYPTPPLPSLARADTPFRC